VKRTAGAHEHLDGNLEPHALDGNLRDLARINAHLGGVAISARAIDAIVEPGAHPVRLLDVGTGAADIPVALLRRGGADSPLEITAIDPRPEIVGWARAAHAGVPGLVLEVADGTALPYPDGAFDVAHASLVLHHLEPDVAGAMLGEMARVARLGVVVNDLDRTWHGWLGAWLLLHVVTRNPYTRHDGPLSVRRAYRPGEVGALAHRHGLREVARHHAPVRHRYAIAFARSPEPSA
jgi:SAM-dependent methyltransferase